MSESGHSSWRTYGNLASNSAIGSEESEARVFFLLNYVLYQLFYGHLLDNKAIPFFSLFSVVRPTQIFAFSKKKRKSYTEGNEGNETLFQTIVTLI